MERKLLLQTIAAVTFVLGLLLFLTQTRSAGEAPEVFRLSVQTDMVFIIGIVLIASSIALLVLSFYVGKKRNKHP